MAVFIDAGGIGLDVGSDDGFAIENNRRLPDSALIVRNGDDTISQTAIRCSPRTIARVNNNRRSRLIATAAKHQFILNLNMIGYAPFRECEPGPIGKFRAALKIS
jgi:hypothetical protein